jgi:septal ring factor EnvC (AmiA/AmiB activator)
MKKAQERILINMELFNGKSIQDIKETIIESKNTNEFNEFTQRLIALQENMKEFSRIETQHETICKKREENTRELITIKEKITEEGKKLEESQEILRTIEKEIKSTKEAITIDFDRLEENAEKRSHNTVQIIQEEIREASKKQESIELVEKMNIILEN